MLYSRNPLLTDIQTTEIKIMERVPITYKNLVLIWPGLEDKYKNSLFSYYARPTKTLNK